MNHEFWNEIGNLYYMCGAYEPAIHAYLRSIKLENTFGRSYSNLALAYVQTGKYYEAIKIYRRGIELLVDQKEKAATWNRLGILYRQIKEYDHALEAYQRADLILPPDEAEKALEVRTEAKLPLTVSMPEINLDAILAKGKPVTTLPPYNDLVSVINAELEMAESFPEELKFEQAMAQLELNNHSQTEAITFESAIGVQSEWEIAYSQENLLLEDSSSVPSILETAVNETVDPNTSAPVELQNVSISEVAQVDEVSVSESQIEPSVPPELPSVIEEHESVEAEASIDHCTQLEPPEVVVIEASAAPIQHIQVDTPIISLSAEEQHDLDLEIIKYQQATAKNPRSYILWENLGEAYKSAGLYKDAILAFQKAISLNPTNAMCHYRLGLVYAAEKREQEAIRAFEKVLEIDPRSPQAHASLASQYRKMGMEEIAQMHIEKARAMQSEDESDYNHACLEAICGNNERALELLEVALQSKQTYVSWAQNDPDFYPLHNDQRFQTLLSTYA
jgi:tetratricopeptide (TPR) repeat protein